mmetsp:Transcript_10886/g.15087  ORF Transcript_10886/g.15087 Transcript_10886/m.15087 type:complete len:350 (-) Transcript_10886:703-1752(-)
MDLAPESYIYHWPRTFGSLEYCLSFACSPSMKPITDFTQSKVGSSCFMMPSVRPSVTRDIAKSDLRTISCLCSSFSTAVKSAPIRTGLPSGSCPGEPTNFLTVFDISRLNLDSFAFVVDSFISLRSIKVSATLSVSPSHIALTKLSNLGSTSACNEHVQPASITTMESGYSSETITLPACMSPCTKLSFRNILALVRNRVFAHAPIFSLYCFSFENLERSSITSVSVFFSEKSGPFAFVVFGFFPSKSSEMVWPLTQASTRTWGASSSRETAGKMISPSVISCRKFFLNFQRLYASHSKLICLCMAEMNSSLLNGIANSRLTPWKRMSMSTNVSLITSGCCTFTATSRM